MVLFKSEINWNKYYPYFLREDNWGDVDKVQPVLVQALYDLRIFVRTPIILSSAVGGVHKDWAHPAGYAGDIVFPERRLRDTFDLFIAASRFPSISSIGLYTFWKYKGKAVPGMHIGTATRGLRRYWIHDKRAGKIEAFGINFEALKRFGLAWDEKDDLARQSPTR